MKRYLLPLAFLLLCASCEQKEQKEVRRVAQPYLDATANYRLDEAMPYASAETQHSLEVMRDVLLPMTDTAAILANQPATVTINSIRIADDTCATVFYHKKTPIKEYDSEIGMRKRAGEWKVYMPINQKSAPKE